VSAIEFPIPTGGIGPGLLVRPWPHKPGLLAERPFSAINDVALRRDQEVFPSQVLVARFGRSSVSPFLLGPDRETVTVGHGVTGYLPQGRWAVMATEPATPVGTETETLTALVNMLASQRLRPVFAAVGDPHQFTALGMATMPIAEDPVIDLHNFSLSGKRRASIRHSVSSARRAGLTMLPWSRELAAQCAEVSRSWLCTKRGGEMGFTLGRFDPTSFDALDCHVAVDGEGRVVALSTWHSYDDGRSRVLDLMRRCPDAPNPAMDFLLAESLTLFADAGVNEASLGSVPLSHGRLAERVYPTRSLWRYKEKFAPRWEERHLAAPARRHLPGAALAVVRAYCPNGLRRGLRRNV
jgi:lysylphosphatidylglycerol synthetase-like protein (DUF2156 family)